jgi:magnesium transporter
LRVLWREWLTGLLLGVLLGAIGFVYIWVLHRNAAFAAVIGLAILFICMWSNCVGALVPILARRFGIDPAVISAPLISTLVDATGLVIFYTVAIILLIKMAGTGAGVH